MGLRPTTPPDVVRMRIAIKRQATSAERMAVIDDMVTTSRHFRMAAIRRRHPNATAEEMDWYLAVELLGPEMAKRVFEERARQQQG